MWVSIFNKVGTFPPTLTIARELLLLKYSEWCLPMVICFKTRAIKEPVHYNYNSLPYISGGKSWINPLKSNRNIQVSIFRKQRQRCTLLLYGDRHYLVPRLHQWSLFKNISVKSYITRREAVFPKTKYMLYWSLIEMSSPWTL